MKAKDMQEGGYVKKECGIIINLETLFMCTYLVALAGYISDPFSQLRGDDIDG